LENTLTKHTPAPKEPTWARLFPLDQITVLQAQFFDNTAHPAKGRSDYALKLFAWTSGWNIDIKNPEWWRVIQLIEPNKVLKWATTKHAKGEMSDAQARLYGTCVRQCEQAQQSGEAKLVRMGHIASPPGKHYFTGQFVIVIQMTTDELIVQLHNDGEALDLTEFTPTKKAGRTRLKGTPTLAMIHDPHDILGKQREEARKLKEQGNLRARLDERLAARGMRGEE